MSRYSSTFTPVKLGGGCIKNIHLGRLNIFDKLIAITLSVLPALTSFLLSRDF